MVHHYLLNRKIRVSALLIWVTKVNLQARTQISRSSPSTTLDTVAQATAATVGT